MPVKSRLIETGWSIRTVHTGRKAELLKVEGITADMFPAPGRKRKWSDGGRYEPGYFCTSSRPGGRWMVTRHKEKIERASIEDGVEIVAMRDKMLNARRERAREERARETPPQAITTAHLSQQAIEVAEGWTLLPPRHKAHVMMLITDCLMTLVDSPTVNTLYANANWHDQARYEQNIANRK